MHPAAWAPRSARVTFLLHKCTGTGEYRHNPLEFPALSSSWVCSLRFGLRSHHLQQLDEALCDLFIGHGLSTSLQFSGVFGDAVGALQDWEIT